MQAANDLGTSHSAAQGRPPRARVGHRERPPWVGYGVAVVCVAAAAALRAALYHATGGTLPFLTFFPAVTFAAIYGGLGAGVLALLLSTLLAAVWIEPLGSPVAFRPADLVALALFLAAGGLIVWVCHRVRRAQREVRAASAAQARLAAVVGSSDDAMFSKSLEGTIESWNAAAERLFGYGAEQIVGRSVYLLVPEERRAEEQEVLERLARGERVDPFQTLRLRSDGSSVEVAVSLSPLRDEAGRVTGVSTVARDLTERRRSEAARQMSEFRFQRLVEQSPLSTQIFAPDGTVRQVNGAWERLWGVTLAELPGYNILQDPQLKERGVLPLVERAFAGEAATIEPIPYMPDRGRYAGQVRWCGAYVYPVMGAPGRVEEVVLVHNDVTDRKAAEEALALSQLRLQTLFDNTQDAIFLADDQACYVDANPAACQLTGYGRGELLGRSVWDLTPLPDRTAGDELWQQFIRAGRQGGEYTLLRKDGTAVAVEYRAVANILPGLHLSVLRDVSQRKRDEQERQRLLLGEQAARAEAERLNQLKDEFLATLSHELRTPLNAILGWSSLLSARSGLDPDVRNAMEVIQRNARAQAKLIEDLLDLSSIISGKVRLDTQPLDLAGVIEPSLESLRPTAEAKGVRLAKLLDPDAGLVRGDAGRLQQVVWNLLSNAIKFTPRGGLVEVLLRRAASHVEVVVADTGQGVAPEFLPYVFEKFRQADGSSTRRHGGLGIGLSVVKSLVELHGGAVRAESAGQDRGTTFAVSLPLLAVQGAEEPAAPPAAAGPPHATRGALLSGLRVLAVDDEFDARELVQCVLQGQAAEVCTAGSSREALDLLGTQRFDVLVSDVGMPEGDGYDLIRALREREGTNRSIPAAALTAYARAEDRTQALLAGYQAHLTKPVEPAELVAAIASLAGRADDRPAPPGRL